MYGMVNKAIAGLISRDYGIEKWNLVRMKAGVEDAIFIGTESYDDSIIYSLVSTASTELKVPAEDLLKNFGKYWVSEIGGKSYSVLMDAAGSDLMSFYTYLPMFHKRVKDILPQLRPPRFQVDQRSATSLVLHYSSHRPGLKCFVEGLIVGLGERFEQKVKYRCLYDLHEEDTYRLGFFIRWKNSVQGVLPS